MLEVYGKKPRKSKGLEMYEIDDMSFFLYSAKSTTKGLCEVYVNKEPYILLKVLEDTPQAKMWLMINIDRIKERLASVCIDETITRDEHLASFKVEKVEKQSKNILTLEECQEAHNRFIQEIRSNNESRRN